MLVTVMGLATASGQQQFIADKVVAVVGNFPVLYSDVSRQAQQMTEQYRSQNYTSPRDPMAEALELLLEQKLLYNRAQIDSVGIEGNEGRIAQLVENNIEAMVTDAGSIKALETQRHKPMYEIREELRKDFEEYLAADEMRGHIEGQVKVTPGEVDRFYRRIDHDSLPIIPEQYIYAQITKFPKSRELAKQRARERLLELRQRIIDGERFDRLAVMYSVDPGSAMRGGEYDPQPKESWVGPFSDAVAKLQPGQVSGVVETEYGFHIIQLMDKPGDNLYHVRHILLKPTYTTDEQTETINFLDSLAGVIRSGEGDLTFEKAAMLHSDDEASRMNGGVVTDQEMRFRITGNSDPSQTRYRHIKDNLDPGDATYLIRMKVGEISRAFIGRDMKMDETGKMLKLVEIVPAHKADINEDYLDIEQMALTRKQQAHYKKWLDAKIDETYIRIDPMFEKEDFENKKWFK